MAPPRTMYESQGQARLAVVVPCYNEEEMLPAFFAAVTAALNEATDGAWTIVCVDDGSRDATAAVIEDYHRRDPRIVGVRLSRNFGHQAALSAGLACAHGEFVGIMDCDMQDPIKVLVELYRACRRDELDVCYGVRAKRDAPLLLRAAYSLFYRVINKTADHEWPRDVGDFCVMSARCQDALLALPEQSRMLRGLRSWVGFRQAGISYDRPARLHGHSKYNLPRLVALALQGLISFSQIPLRLATIMGAAMGLFSLLFGTLVLLNRLFPKFTAFGYWIGASPGIATLVVFLAFMLSVLFVCLGIVGEYLIVLLQEIKRRPAAIIASRIGDIRLRHSSYSVFAAVDRAVENVETR